MRGFTHLWHQADGWNCSGWDPLQRTFYANWVFKYNVVSWLLINPILDRVRIASSIVSKNLKKNKKSPSSGYSNGNGGLWLWNKREIMAIQLHSYTTKTTTFQPNLQSLLQISFRYLQSNYFYFAFWCVYLGERERGCCVEERIQVVGFDGEVVVAMAVMGWRY